MPNIAPPIADPEGCGPSGAEGRSAVDWRQFSHELRTPLNAILGNVELLLDGSAGPLSAEARACIGEVQAGSHRLSRQVRWLLAWSEVCSRASQLSRIPVDLIALWRETLLEAAGATRIEPADARLQIGGDRFWLQMLLREVAALEGAPGAPSTLRVERRNGRATLDFVWRNTFGAQRGAPLQTALIDAIARAHGAAVVPRPNGLALRWSPERRGRA